MRSYFMQTAEKRQHIFLLHGLGGAGKTQIGLKFVQDVSFHFSNMFHLDMSTTETIETGFKNMAIKKNVGKSLQDALRWLSDESQGWLLFFDNADDPQINLNEYFPKCNHGSILITSRNPGLGVHAGAHALVSDMEETEAVELLLKSAAQEITLKNKDIAADIVKVSPSVHTIIHALWYFPLAIIQAGAFIAKSGVLSSYLTLYTANRARLLSEKPTQSHDEYAWTVYTTWQMSFEKLSKPARKLLQLCSFLHHQGISEQIFSNATKYETIPGHPSEEELQEPRNFLSHYLGPIGAWDPLNFMHITNELRAYSLITFNSETNTFSIHPLVHSWSRSMLSNEAAYHHCMVGILGMCLANMDWGEKETTSLWLMPHLESLLQNRLDTEPDFNLEFGSLYLYSARVQKAEQLQTIVLEKQKTALGTDDPQTLMTMGNLAGTCVELGQFKDAETLTTAVLKKQKQILGEDHRNTIVSMSNLGWIFHSLDRLKEAEEIQSAAIEKGKRLLGHEDSLTIWTMGNLGSTYRNMGQLKLAEELELSALETQRKILGEDHPNALWTMGNLALTYKEQGHLKMAQEIQVVVLEKKKRILGDQHPETVRAKAELDSTCTALARFNGMR
ncbi:P-loop containing nucleoside triphosphate hydrolase protein [Mycena galopus ATCC 62051]|nr:P-loop containing nucleoside triphosphate hydrolase protein [Mycena galopus ATCC 62051]